MIPAPQKPTVTAVHAIPGRLRMRLSVPLQDPTAMLDFLQEHDGMHDIAYTPSTGSLLVRFEPNVIASEEITLRTAFRFAMDLGNVRVRLLAAPESSPLQHSAMIAGIGLLTALGMRWLRPESATRRAFETLAGVGTAWSVADHGWHELRERGYFDPEVFALAYLVPALVRGNVLSASVVTWLATFGRHLVELPTTGVQVEPVPISSHDGERGFELVVRPDSDASDRLQLGVVGFFNSALRYAMTGGGSKGLRSFSEELRDMSRVHGEVLEGYSRQRGGIPVRFR